MITEKDLQEAIAECQGKRNPDSSTCIKLAAFYTIRRELYGDRYQDAPPAYSFSSGPEIPRVDFKTGSAFSRRIDGRPAADIWPIIEELVEAVQATNPRLYAHFIKKLG